MLACSPNSYTVRSPVIATPGSLPQPNVNRGSELRSSLACSPVQSDKGVTQVIKKETGTRNMKHNNGAKMVIEDKELLPFD